MPSAESPMALDESTDAIDATPAKDNDGVPYCPKHHCRMTRVSGGKKGSVITYFTCSVAECDAKSKMIKTNHPGVVPSQPLACPRCSKGDIPVFCERDGHASSAASVILKCPSCSWKSGAMAVPQLAAAHFASRKPLRPPVPGVGDR